MKKIVTVILVCALLISLTSCKKMPQTTAKISSSSSSVALLDGTLTIEGALKELNDFKDVADVYVFDGCVIAIKSDKTLEIKGDLNKNLEDARGWTDIVKLAGTVNYLVGLKSDGSCVAVGDNSYGQADVSVWKNIVDVAASGGHTVGLKKDGSVVAIGRNDHGQCDVSEFKDIKAIAAGQMCTIAIKNDGSAMAAGNNRLGLDNIKHYKNIKEISVADDNGIILQNDGTVHFFGYKKDVADPETWQNIVKVFASPIGYYAINNEGNILYYGDNTFLEQDNGSKEIIKNKVTIQ